MAHEYKAYLTAEGRDRIIRKVIVSIDFSPNVNAVCELLKAFNIDSKHIAIEKIFSK